MKTTFSLAAAAALLSLAAAQTATAQVNVDVPPAGGVEVQAPGTNVTVPPGTGAAIRADSAIRQENRIERRANRQAVRSNVNDWRMVNHENRWWYYHPNNSWSYYQNNRWNAWQAPAARTFSTQPMPNRYQSGYRGPMNNNLAAPPDVNAPARVATPAPAPTGPAPGTLPAGTNPAPANDPSRTP